MKMTLDDVSAIIQKANQEAKQAISNAIEQYKAENPDVDVEAVLSEQMELLSKFRQVSSREVDKFVAYAKEQGTKMSFDSMEMGILAAGRKDMQNGLTEIANSLKFSKPDCPECGKGMENRGLRKKNF